MKSSVAILLTYLSAVLVRAQTITTTDLLGDTIIEVVTTDPVLGLPTTIIQETLAGDETTNTLTDTTTQDTQTTEATTTTTSPTTTTTPVQQGPVGEPAATQTGETVFQYTTTDADGDTIVLTGTFTPTFESTQPIGSPTFTGTILNYSQWLSLVGSNTVPAVNAALERWKMPKGLWVASVASLTGMLGGAWLVAV